MNQQARMAVGLHQPLSLISKWVKALRHSSGMTQIEIANTDLELAYKSVRNWETAKAMPDAPHTFELMDWEIELLANKNPMDMHMLPFVKILVNGRTQDQAMYVLQRYAAAVQNHFAHQEREPHPEQVISRAREPLHEDS